MPRTRSAGVSLLLIVAPSCGSPSALASVPVRQQPGLVHAGLGVAILLLILWSPVRWTHQFWTLLGFTIAAFVWLEWIRRRTQAEFPDEAPVRLSWPKSRSAKPTQPKVT